MLGVAWGPGTRRAADGLADGSCWNRSAKGLVLVNSWRLTAMESALNRPSGLMIPGKRSSEGRHLVGTVRPIDKWRLEACRSIFQTTSE